MNPLMSSSLNARSSGQSYHQPGSTLGGGPPRGLGYSATGPSPVPNSSIGDTSKLHNLYAPGCGNPGSLGGSIAQSAQYPSQDGRYQQPLSDYSPSAFSENLNRLHQHSANIVPQSSISPMSMGPSGYHSRGIMEHYSDPRMPSNLGPPQQTPPTHELGASYLASSYSYGHGDHLSSGSGLWQNQGMSPLQERSSYGYQTGLHNSGPSVSVSNLPMSDLRSGQSYGHSSSEFSSLHQQPSTQQRSFYSSNQNESSSLSSHIPSDCSSISSYSTHQGPYSASHGTESSVNLNQNRGSSRLSHSDALRQTQFSVSYSGPNVNLQSSHPQPSTPPNNLSSSSGSSIPPINSGSNVRYPHRQYSTYSTGQLYGDTSSSASRLSPYGLPNSGPKAGSNSPNFRPNQLTASSRTLERMSNSGLSLQPVYSSPGASHIKNSSSNILSSSSSNSALSHISSSQLASSSNSLHQLEQMAMAHLSPTLASNKMTPVSSVASPSTPNSFYSPSVSSNSIQSSQAAFQQPTYSQYSCPSSASTGLSQQSPNYYQQQQQQQQYQSSTSNMWQAQSNRSSTSPHLNTHASITSAAYSAQQLSSTQKQQDSSSSVNSSATAVASITDSQYSLFENESEHAKSIISLNNSEASILSPCQSNISQIQSQQESLSPFGIRGSVNKSGVPFGSPHSSQEEELKQSKSQSDSKDSKLENEFGLKQSQSHEQTSNLFNVLASPESIRFSN